MVSLAKEKKKKIKEKKKQQLLENGKFFKLEFNKLDKKQNKLCRIIQEMINNVSN